MALLKQILDLFPELNSTQWALIGLLLFAGADGARGYIADVEAEEQQEVVAEELVGGANTAIESLSDEISDLKVEAENLRLRIQLLELEKPAESEPKIHTSSRSSVIEIFSPTAADVRREAKKNIRDVVTSNHDAYQKCYMDEILSSGELFSGTLALTFTVTGQGFVSAVVVEENTMDKRSLGTCVSRAVRSLVFSPSLTKEPVTITYPFSFSPSESTVAELSAKRTKAAKEQVKARTDQLKVSVPKF